MLAEFLNLVLRGPRPEWRRLRPRVVERREQILVLIFRIRVAVEVNAILALKPGRADCFQLPVRSIGMNFRCFWRELVPRTSAVMMSPS